MSSGGNVAFNNRALAKYSGCAFKLTLVLQFYFDKFNPWLEPLQSHTDLTL